MQDLKMEKSVDKTYETDKTRKTYEPQVESTGYEQMKRKRKINIS